MNFLTESLDLPQNEQRRCLSWDMGIADTGDGGVSEPVRAESESAKQRPNGNNGATAGELTAAPEPGQADLRERAHRHIAFRSL